ncbi:MAG: sulfatase/phosphatase domain-containing protein [Verrucomicrobiales bacterium]
MPHCCAPPVTAGLTSACGTWEISAASAPTFLDLAGVSVPPDIQSASWKALASGQKPANWRKSFLAEYSRELGDTPTSIGARTTDAKLVKYPRMPEWTEPFDLAVDPYDVKNLAADPTAAAKLSAEFDAEVKAMHDAVPPPAARSKKSAGEME